MKMGRKFKKAIVLLLCISLVMTNVMLSFAESSKPVSEEIVNEVENSEEIIQEVDKVTTDEEKAVEDSDDSEDAEKELAEENEENNEEIADELGEEPEEEPEAEPEENPEEEPEEEIEAEPEKKPEEEIEAEPEEKKEADLEEIEDAPEEVDVSSPSEIIDEENDDNAATLEEPEGNIEEKEALLDAPASPSDAEENENVINDEEVSSPSELEKPMLLTAPLFGATDPEVWKIGDKGYKSLQDAIDAATDGCTIEPGDDYETNDTISVPSVSYDNFGINIPYSSVRGEYRYIKNYTIDFNGNPLKFRLGKLNGNFPLRGLIRDEAEFLVKLKGINGVELDFTEDWVGEKVIPSLIEVTAHSGLEIEDCTFEYNDETFEIESLFGNSYAGKVIIGDGNNITIPKNVAQKTDIVVKENSTSTITVTDGNCFESCPAKIKGGTFIIENGSFMHTLPNCGVNVEFSNANITVKGTSAENALIDIDAHVGATFDSGTYNLEEANFIHTDGTYGVEEGSKSGDITINGGKFKFKKLVDGSEENDVKFDLKGGFYKYTGSEIDEGTSEVKTTEAIISPYVNTSDVYSAQTSSDGDYDVEVTERDTYPWEIDGTKYTSLQKAIDAATDGCVIEPSDDYDERSTFIITEDNASVTIDNDVNFTIDFKKKPMYIKSTGIFFDDQFETRIDEAKACAIHKKGTNEVTIKNIKEIRYIKELIITGSTTPTFPILKVSGKLNIEDCKFNFYTGLNEQLQYVYSELFGLLFSVGDGGDFLYTRVYDEEDWREAFPGLIMVGGKAEVRNGYFTCGHGNFSVSGGTLKLSGGYYQTHGALVSLYNSENGGGNVEIDGTHISSSGINDDISYSVIHYEFYKDDKTKPIENTKVKLKNLTVEECDNLVTVHAYDHIATSSTVEVESGKYNFKDGIFKFYKYEPNLPDSIYYFGGAEVSLKGGIYHNIGGDWTTTLEKVTPYVAEGYTTKKQQRIGELDYNIEVVNDERKWQIGETTYRTLQEAVDEVASGDTIERITSADNEAFLVNTGSTVVNVNGKEDFIIDFKNDPLMIYLNYNLEDNWSYDSYSSPVMIQLSDSKNVTIKNINKIKFDTTSPNYQELFRWTPEYPPGTPEPHPERRNTPLLHPLIFNNSGAKLMFENCDFTYGDVEINNLGFLNERKGGVSFNVNGGETIIGDNNKISSGKELANVYGGKFTVKEGSNSTFSSTNKGFIVTGGEVEINGGRYTLNASAVNGYGVYWYQSLAFLDFEQNGGIATVSNAEVIVGTNSDKENSLVEFDLSGSNPMTGKTITFTSGTYNVPGNLVFYGDVGGAASNTVKITGGKYQFGQGPKSKDETDGSVKLIVEGGSFMKGWGGETEDKISPYVPTGYMTQTPSSESGYETDVVKAEYVCKVGTNKYYTIQEAVDAVTENGTIDVINDVFGKDQISIKDKKFTINFNDGTTQYSFKNPKGTGKDIFLIENSEVTVNDFKYTIGNVNPKVERNTIFKVKSDGKLTLNNTICDSADNIADTIVYNEGGEVVVDGGDITTATSNGMFVNVSGGKYTIKDGVFNANSSASRFLVADTTDSKYDFRNGKVKFYPGYFCVIKNGYQTIKSVTITSGKFGKSSGYNDIKDEISGFKAENTEVVTIDEDGYIYEIKASGPACKIGTTEYLTLEEALEAAVTGDTITMIRDIIYENKVPDFVVDGKTIIIDFAGYKMKFSITSAQEVRKFFTVTNQGDLTIENTSLVLEGNYANQLTHFTVSGANSKLTLKDVTQTSGGGDFLTIDGGEAIIDGGAFGTSNYYYESVLTNNAKLTLKNNPVFTFSSTIFQVGKNSIDADTVAGNITIEDATFIAKGLKVDMIKLCAKANVTINGGTLDNQGNNELCALIAIESYGHNSNVTINNFTSNSSYVFKSTNNPNIEQFTATINNGHYRYLKGQFAVDTSTGLKPAIKLSAGYFGPIEYSSAIADDDALAELTAICPAGKKVEVLATEDPEYANGYRYKVVDNGGSSTGGGGSTGGGLSSSRSSGGSSGGGGGGGGGGSTGGTTNGALATSTRHDPSSDPDLTGPITVTTWNSDATGTQASDIRYAQNTDSFVHSDNTPVVSDWVGVNTSTTTKVAWYRTDATGKICKNTFIRIGDIVYYFDANGVMVTGDFEIDGVVYHFDTTPGATEGKLLI